MTTPTSDKSFVWNELADWKELVFAQLHKCERKEILKCSKVQQNKFKYCDDVSFARDLCSNFADVELILNDIAADLRSKYGYVRMFHCCCPESVDSYYEHGIQVLDVEQANQLFTSIVSAVPKFSHVTAGHYKYAFDSLADSDGRNGSVYFGLDNRFLIDHSHHYLRYGSEYFQALADRIDGKVQNTDGKVQNTIKEYLRTKGQPTIFVVDIPKSALNPNEIRCLVTSMLTTCLYNYSHGGNTPYKIDFTISITAALPPDRIVRHFHPPLDRICKPKGR